MMNDLCKHLEDSIDSIFGNEQQSRVWVRPLKRNAKPNPSDYGYEDNGPFEPGGWVVEGGQEAYELALSNWNQQKLSND